MNLNDLKPGIIVRRPVLPERIEVLVVTPLGDMIKLTGAGQKTGKVLEAMPERRPFDGDPACGYPAPIVDHRAARDRALAVFAAVKAGGGGR